MILRFLRVAAVAFRKIVVSTGATETLANASPTITSGSGVPTASEPKGSIYLRTGGSSAATVMYVATDSVGTWTALANTAVALQVAVAAGQSFVLDLLLAATGEAIVKLADNLAVAAAFKEGANSYLTFVTTNSGEQVVVGQRLVLSKGLTRTPGASTAAAGTTTADAGVLPAGTASVYPTTAADDTKGVRINAADQVTGNSFFIGNGVSNKILKVYAPSGGTINGAAVDAAFSTASGCWVHCLDGTANTWLAA